MKTEGFVYEQYSWRAMGGTPVHSASCSRCEALHNDESGGLEAFLDLENLVRKHAVRLAVDVDGRLRGGRFDEAKDFPPGAVKPVLEMPCEKAAVGVRAS
jgi:hypothetical protein